MNIERFNTALRAYEAMIKVLTKNTVHVVRADAPNTFSKLQTWYARDGYITVSSVGCNSTIFSEPSINYLFRVWHDSIHILLCADFSLQGETDTYEWQVHEMLAVLKAFGYSDMVQDDIVSIMTWDILGQVNYYYEHKQYVDNQKEFVMKNLGLAV